MEQYHITRAAARQMLEQCMDYLTQRTMPENQEEFLLRMKDIHYCLIAEDYGLHLWGAEIRETDEGVSDLSRGNLGSDSVKRLLFNYGFLPSRDEAASMEEDELDLLVEAYTKYPPVTPDIKAIDPLWYRDEDDEAYYGEV